MKIGLSALILRPACVLGVFFVKKRGDRPRLIVDCRKTNTLFATPPPVQLLSGDGLSRIEVGASGLVHGESPGTVGVPMLPTVSTACVSGDIHHFSVGRGVERVSQDHGDRRNSSFVQSSSLADVLFVTSGSTSFSPQIGHDCTDSHLCVVVLK